MPESSAPTDAEVRETLKRLRATPRHFKRSAAGFSDAQLRRPPEKGAWSMLEILAHLRGAADVQGGWISKMLADDTATIRVVSPRTGMKKTGYETQDFHAFLRAFARQRAELVKTLSSLKPADWSRSATFTGTKPGWAPTVFHMALGIGAHENGHFAQITAAVPRSK